MTNEPKFSAIIATYNRTEYLLQAVQSVVQQTHPPHEIIVVADGSPPGLVAAVRARYPQVRIFEQPNLGRPIARNTGIAQATGDWICFLDDDDIWHRDKLGNTRKYLAENPDCVAVNNLFWTFSGREGTPGETLHLVASDVEECHAAAAGSVGEIGESYLNIRGNSHRLLLERCRGALSFTAIRRDIAIRAGCFPPASFTDDWDLFINTARLTEWHTIPEKLGFARMHEGQGTRTEASPLKLLSALAAIWHGGRPLPQAASEAETRRVLASYAYEYKRLVQRLFWHSLLVGDFRTARAVRKFGWLLLPRRRDRIYAALPPQITWRFERYILGMHKQG